MMTIVDTRLCLQWQWWSSAVNEVGGSIIASHNDPTELTTTSCVEKLEITKSRVRRKVISSTLILGRTRPERPYNKQASKRLLK